MSIQIEKAFFEAADKLEKPEQLAVWALFQKLVENPKHPSLSLERIKESYKQSLWSARGSLDLRAVLGKDGEGWALLFVGHHEDAYAWARDRGFERNPETDEIQVVRIPETVLEVAAEPPAEPTVFGPDDVPMLTAQGVPIDLVPIICRLRSDSDLIDLSRDLLPEEVIERLLRLRNGEELPPARAPKRVDGEDPIGRGFTVVRAPEELARLLDKPIEEWTRFLHPDQRRVAYGDFKSSIKVTGAAGTGKTVVALHRTHFLAKSGKKVLLTSFTTTLCSNLRRSLQLLCNKYEAKQITVATIDQQARKLSGLSGLCDGKRWTTALSAALDGSQLAKNAQFRAQVSDEWDFVIERQGIVSREEYLAASRKGRETPMPANDRGRVWEVIQSAVDEVEQEGLLPPHYLARRAIDRLESGEIQSPFDVVVVDEVQDLGVAHLKLARKLAVDEENGVTLVGDGGQRIYPGGYSLKELGIDVRGRSFRLDLNYRSSLQILRAAERVLKDGRDDLDEGMETGWSTRSLLRGPEPRFQGAKSEDDLKLLVATEVERLLKSGLQPREIAVVARIKKLLENLQAALSDLGIPAAIIVKDDQELPQDSVRVLTMHRAKGLEFKAVIVAYASDQFLPFYKSLERAHEKGDADEALRLDRQLLYVAMTRARDELAVFWHGKPSRFLEPVLSEVPQ